VSAASTFDLLPSPILPGASKAKVVPEGYAAVAWPAWTVD
jgi:hypothetical protein